MTLLLSAHALSKSFGTRTLFQEISLSIFAKERIGLIGPNGSGKTTLLKILAALETPDIGTVAYKKGVKIGYLPQTCEHPDQTPLEILLETLKKDEALADYEKERIAKMWLSKFGFSGQESSAATLSGGWKKRLSLAKELILSPDLLLLDEPTNHLDLEGILFLEHFLSQRECAYLLVSHDRYFLQNTTSRTIEINSTYPKGIFSIDGSYLHFLEKKEEFLEGQESLEKSLSSKATREKEWLSRKAKARTTKAQSRIDEAEDLFSELAQVKERNRQKRASIDFVATERQTRKLLTAKNLQMKVKDRLLFRNLNFTLSPFSRLGLMGPNGAGKTTLLRLLAGEILPDSGTIKPAEGLKVVYFDQHRMQLAPHLSIREALSPNGDFVSFRGKPVHVNGWCKRFLFSPDLLDMPIAKLSGGERARISIAHLMLQPADLLLLDEPTNDLDIPTLETLEESLIDFPGALVLITHDRCMLDRLCNSLMMLGHSEEPQFFADFAQWESAQKPSSKILPEKKKEVSSKDKLSLQERKEYGLIEKKIGKLEKEVHEKNLQLEDPLLAQNQEALQEICSSIALLENQIEQLYLRWEELEKKLQN